MKAEWYLYALISQVISSSDKKQFSTKPLCESLLIYCWLDDLEEMPLTLQPNTLIFIHNKANLRDLIAATGLVILLKLDSNHRFFSPCDLEIWWMTPKNNRAPLLCYFKLFVSFHSHWWIQTGVTVWKCLIWVKIDDFFNRVTLQFDVRPCKNRAPVPCYSKLCASFRSHWWIQIGVTLRKRPIRVKFDNLF